MNTQNNSRLIVDLTLSAEKYQLMYAGAAKHVLAYSRDGRSIRFPAHILRPFVTREGVQGSFVIEFDQNNRLVGINRL